MNTVQRGLQGNVGGEIQALRQGGNRVTADARVASLNEYFGGVPKDLSVDHIYSHGSNYGTINDAMMERFAKVFKDKVYGLIKYKNWSPWIFLYPWHYVKPNEGIDIVFNELVCADGIAPQLAPLGVPRLYEIKRSERGDRMVRRGAGIFIESTFFMTPEGRERYRIQLQQLAAITLKTCEHDIAVEILNAWSNQPKRAYQLNGSYQNMDGSSDTYMDFLRSEVETWAIVNKSPDSEGFLNLITRLETLMHVYRDGANPDTLVLPPNMKRFYSYHKDLRTYSEAGSLAISQRKKNLVPAENGVPLDTFNNYTVVDTQIYRSTTASRFEAGDLFTVNEQIGEWVPMDINDAIKDDRWFKEDSWNGRMRNILIYDNKKDDMVEIPFVDAVKNAYGGGMQVHNPNVWSGLQAFVEKYGEDTGNDAVISHTNLFDDDTTALKHFNHMKNSGSLDKALFDADATHSDKDMKSIEYNVKTIQNIILAGKYFPINVVLFRPYQTYSVSTAIMMKRGAETGECYIGHTDFQVSAGSMKKEMGGSWTFYQRAMTKRPENILAIENAMCQRYRCGADNEFLVQEDYNDIRGAGGLINPKRSIIPILLKVQDRPIGSFEDVLDLKADTNLFPHMKKISGLTDALHELNIDGINTKDHANDTRDFEYYSIRPNSICWKGHYEYGPNFSEMSVNKGHWGPYCYPGCGKARDALNYACIEKLYGSRISRSRH